MFFIIISSIAEFYDFEPMEPSTLFIAFCLHLVDEGFIKYSVIIRLSLVILLFRVLQP
jgi:hypothetical protein